MKTLFIVQINKVGGGYRYEITTDVDLVEKHLKNGEEIDDDVPVNKLADISGEVTFFIPYKDIDLVDLDGDEIAKMRL